MNEAARKIPLSPADYLAGEQLSELRHEYVDGAVYAMTGARKTHNLVAGNLARALHAHLRGYALPGIYQRYQGACRLGLARAL